LSYVIDFNINPSVTQLPSALSYQQVTLSLHNVSDAKDTREIQFLSVAHQIIDHYLEKKINLQCDPRHKPELLRAIAIATTSNMTINSEKIESADFKSVLHIQNEPLLISYPRTLDRNSESSNADADPPRTKHSYI
jgi:hypothetical protein